MMDDLDDIKESEFVTDTDDQDSLDEKIDSEQRIQNQQLWASFQNAACCITKLYKDRTQPNVSPWVPFQNAASNLTTLYKDCIESQRRFAKIGYQVGRRKRLKDFKKLLMRHHLQTSKASNGQKEGDINQMNDANFEQNQAASSNQRRSTVSSILAVNNLNLDCDEAASHHIEDKNILNHQHKQLFQPISNQSQNQHDHDSTAQNYSINSTVNVNTIEGNNNQQQMIGNNEEDLVTFQQALVQPAVIRSIKLGSTRRPSINTVHANNNRSPMEHATKSEEDRLLELNQFLSEEYHRHVGSRKRSCASIGGNVIKRARE